MMSAPLIVLRAEARAAGLKRYFTGEPCKHGHVAEREADSGTCVTCKQSNVRLYRAENAEKIGIKNREHHVRYYAANSAKVHETHARYRAENAERIREQRSAYRARTVDQDRERNAAWRGKNTDRVRQNKARYRIESAGKVSAHNAKRRARKLNAATAWDTELTDFVMQESSDLARLRMRTTGFAWHVDHMIPLQARTACGLHTWSNLQVIPARLNVVKNNRLIFTEPGEWIMAA